MYQNQLRVCVEFLKSSKGIGTRIIKLNYGPQAIPPQLMGRMDMNMWGAFMQECAVLAERHPYVIKPSGKQVGSWALCFSIAAVIGCAAINPDGGSYPQWEQEVSQMLARWRDSFGHAGLSLSLQRTREHWIQIDLVGPPPMGPPSQPAKEGYEHKQGYEGAGYAPQQGGYQPPGYAGGSHPPQQQQQWNGPPQGQYPQQGQQSYSQSGPHSTY
jgi:hypothetical protein